MRCITPPKPWKISLKGLKEEGLLKLTTIATIIDGYKRILILAFPKKKMSIESWYGSF